MIKTELMKAIRKSKYVFGWVVATKHEGYYIQLTKGSCVATFKKLPYDEDIEATLRPDGDLYIA